MKLRYVTDYFDAIQERFPELDRHDIDKILRHGLRSLYTLKLAGADVFCQDHKFVMFFGRLFRDKKKANENYVIKKKIKLRIKYFAKNPQRIWDGNYYFGLTEDQYNEFIPKNKRRQKVTLTDIDLVKIPEEAMICRKYQYFYQVTGLEDKGMHYKAEELTTRNLTLIATRNGEGKITYCNNE